MDKRDSRERVRRTGRLGRCSLEELVPVRLDCPPERLVHDPLSGCPALVPDRLGHCPADRLRGGGTHVEQMTEHGGGDHGDDDRERESVTLEEPLLIEVRDGLCGHGQANRQNGPYDGRLVARGILGPFRGHDG
jgi:hypothetical protein